MSPSVPACAIFTVFLGLPKAMTIKILKWRDGKTKSAIKSNEKAICVRQAIYTFRPCVHSTTYCFMRRKRSRTFVERKIPPFAARRSSSLYSRYSGNTFILGFFAGKFSPPFGY